MSVFAVLAEPNRRQLLDALRLAPHTVTDLTEVLKMSQPAVSKHLRVLRDADLVIVRPDGQRRWYALNPEPLFELESWLGPYRELWGHRLDRLEQHLDETE